MKLKPLAKESALLRYRVIITARAVDMVSSNLTHCVILRDQGPEAFTSIISIPSPSPSYRYNQAHATGQNADVNK